jgi:hypothetical protein
MLLCLKKQVELTIFLVFAAACFLLLLLHCLSSLFVLAKPIWLLPQETQQGRGCPQ